MMGKGNVKSNEGKDWIFLSDAHFNGENRDNQERLIRFLEVERGNLATLVFLGDLFEFWFGFEGHVYEEYLPILQQLKSLSRGGVRIKYIEGNHDFCLGSYFEEDLGVEVYTDEMEELLGDKRVYIAHGDRVNPRDYGYPLFRRILKNQLSYEVIRWGGPVLSMRIAKWLSAKSRRRSRELVPNDIPLFKEFAMKKFREGIDVVILGHSHYPEEIVERIDGKERVYFNVGDWMSFFSYLRYKPETGFELCSYENQP
jgi:UDP-2,3-diacylglucosamine hydrolase